ncbi:hypothetical protein YERSI8AC_200228 [Enterobacterales bacterium 8AC]|nr:hypothetical protein YERSI8AC_200228 [Enterobacterales bacterium 8AC]
MPVAFPAVMVWRKRSSNTPTLHGLSTALSQQKKLLFSITFSVAEVWIVGGGFRGGKSSPSAQGRR